MGGLEQNWGACALPPGPGLNLPLIFVVLVEFHQSFVIRASLDRDELTRAQH